MKKSIIAIIPARSGSKGLKDKNIKLFNGNPLLAYSIQAAQESGIFDEIFVSTDSELYADISRKFGASVPFLRSNELSSDTASSWDVVKDVLARYEELGKIFEYVVLLQPTSPLRTSQDIQDAFSLLIEKDANAVVSVCEVDHSPLWCNTLPEDGSLVNFISKDIVTKSRQKLQTYYRINGAIYVVKTDYLFKVDSIYDSGCYAYRMDKRKSIDIDDQLDFQIAETLFQTI